jgi:hypothetical protein
MRMRCAVCSGSKSKSVTAGFVLGNAFSRERDLHTLCRTWALCARLVAMPLVGLLPMVSGWLPAR